jgi:hypothetical protein
MRKVTLIFPHTGAMADFLITHKIARAEVNSSQRSVAVTLNEDLIVVACSRYNAEIKAKAGVPFSI